MCYATKTLTLTWGLNQNAENAIAHVWPITIMNAWASYRNGGTLNFVHVLRLSISPYETTLTGPERSVAAMELAVPRLSVFLALLCMRPACVSVSVLLRGVAKSDAEPSSVLAFPKTPSFMIFTAQWSFRFPSSNKVA